MKNLNLLVIFLSFSLLTYAQCDREQDSLILVDFYNSASGSDWDSVWVLSQPMDTWYGVFLSDEGCVECLDFDGSANCELDFGFTNFGIQGSIPESFKDLSNPKSIYFNFASFEQDFPDFLTEMTSLENLMMRSCNLSGEIPDNIGNLVNLEFLHLGNNRLEGQVPGSIGNLEKLLNLYLFNNQLEGPFPVEVANLSNLIRLVVPTNNFGGPVPEELGSMTNLEILNLGDCGFEGGVPFSYQNLESLRNLFLDDNKLAGDLPYFLVEIDSLNYVTFANNNFSGCIPAEISSKCGIAFYDLRGNVLLPFEGDFTTFCEAEPGDPMPCDDGFYGTSNDVVLADCTCLGERDPVECFCDIAGFYTVVTTNLGPDGSCNENVWEGDLEIRQSSDSDEGYQVYTTSELGQNLDMAFGYYYSCYEISDPNQLPNGDLDWIIACDTMYFEGSSQWGEVSSFIDYSFDNDVMVVSVTNDYGETWQSVLTKIDGTGYPNGNICMLDEDGDGYTSDLDCDDTNPSINPDGIEIMDNGIDEDCDGADLTDVLDLAGVELMIFPNPVQDVFTIEYDDFSELNINMYKIDGTFVQMISKRQTNIAHLPAGIYLLDIELSSKQRVTARVMKY